MYFRLKLGIQGYLGEHGIDGEERKLIGMFFFLNFNLQLFFYLGNTGNKGLKGIQGPPGFSGNTGQKG
jgi:hypothetical protein